MRTSILRPSWLALALGALVVCAPLEGAAQELVIVIPMAESPEAGAETAPNTAGVETAPNAGSVETAPPVEMAPSTLYVHEPALEPEPTEAPAAFTPGFFSIGLSALVGTRDDPRAELAPTWTGGIDVGFRILPFLSLGMRRVTVGHASTLAGDRTSIGAAPTLELSLAIAPRIEPYLQVGSAVQVRFGSQGRSVGVAPFVGGGVRFFVADIFSIAVESAVHVPVSEGGFLFGHEVLPQGAVVLQGGLALAFHIR